MAKVPADSRRFFILASSCVFRAARNAVALISARGEIERFQKNTTIVMKSLFEPLPARLEAEQRQLAAGRATDYLLCLDDPSLSCHSRRAAWESRRK